MVTPTGGGISGTAGLKNRCLMHTGGQLARRSPVFGVAQQ